MTRTVNTRDGPLPIDSTERCDFTDLLKVACGHCRGSAPGRPLFHAPDLGGDEDEEDQDAVVATFHAQYGGRCAACDGHFARGSTIHKTAGGDYLCGDCGWAT